MHCIGWGQHATAKQAEAQKPKHGKIWDRNYKQRTGSLCRYGDRHTLLVGHKWWFRTLVLSPVVRTPTWCWEILYNNAVWQVAWDEIQETALRNFSPLKTSDMRDKLCEFGSICVLYSNSWTWADVGVENTRLIFLRGHASKTLRTTDLEGSYFYTAYCFFRQMMHLPWTYKKL